MNEVYKIKYSVMEPAIPIYLCGFRKGYSTQQALMRFVENCREIFDKNGHIGAQFTDLSKAFDCLEHDLLLPSYMHTALAEEYLRSLIATSMIKQRV